MGRFFRTTCCAAAMLVVSALGSPGQARKSGQTAEADRPITLTFAWPDGLRSHVRYQLRMIQFSFGRRNRTSMDMRYLMAVTRVPKGLLIEARDVAAKVDMPDLPQAANPIQKFMTKLAGQSPPYLVSRDGRFRRLHDLPGFTKNLVDGMETAFASMAPPQVIAQLRQMIAAMFNESTVHTMAMADWDVYVGAWRNLRLRPGQSREFVSSAPVPVLGNAKVGMHGTVTLKGRVPCRAGENSRGCVELEMRLAAKPAEMATVLNNYLRIVGGGRAPVAIRKVDQTRTVRIVCDPATLLPYASQSLNKTAVYADGKEPSMAAVKDERMQYTY